MIKEALYFHDDEYYYEIVRANIKKYRLEQKLTQQDLADLSGVSRQYICDIENKNRNKHITIAILGRIADALNINIIEFFIKEDELRVEIKSVLEAFYNTEKEVINS
ncbi:MAG TPA: helix-turn-helix transcriptional regulator [Candidatus Onthocola stercoravium]|nr:helix-turn-helix transcriptional regulator [Candidatus Onthocola stercoravium]